MVVVIKRANKAVYKCEECGFKYENKKVAEKCQAWCKEHKSCNLDIIKYAVNDDVPDSTNA